MEWYVIDGYGCYDFEVCFESFYIYVWQNGMFLYWDEYFLVCIILFFGMDEIFVVVMVGIFEVVIFIGEVVYNSSRFFQMEYFFVLMVLRMVRGCDFVFVNLVVKFEEEGII